MEIKNTITVSKKALHISLDIMHILECILTWYDGNMRYHNILDTVTWYYGNMRHNI